MQLGVGRRDVLALRRLELSLCLKERTGGSVAVRLRTLGGECVRLRPGHTDVTVALDTFFGGYHLAPRELPGDSMRRILDLGANIGLTVAHAAVLYPQARILGVELDHRNARLAARNVEGFGDRCQVLHGAAWSSAGTIRYDTAPGDDWGVRVSADGQQSAQAFSMDELIDRLAPDGESVDYVKMDIEGSEEQVLEGSANWLARVRALKVEIHEPYTAERCAQRLTDLGYHTSIDEPHPPTVYVIGIR